MRPINLIPAIILLTLLAGCASKGTDTPISATGFATIDTREADVKIKAAAHEIAQLPRVPADTKITKENYVLFARKANDVIDILNKQIGFNFQPLEYSTAGYEKVTSTITDYKPLIESYNGAIDAAQDYDKGLSTKKALFLAVGTFGMRLTLIAVTNIPLTPAARADALYSGIGLRVMSENCPTCIDPLLTDLLKFTKTDLSSESSSSASNIIRALTDRFDSAGGLDDVAIGLNSKLFALDKLFNQSGNTTTQ